MDNLTYDLSPTTEFLLQVMCIMSRTLSTLEPDKSWGLTSHMIRWVSVPEVMIFSPAARRAAAMARAFSTTWAL